MTGTAVAQRRAGITQRLPLRITLVVLTTALVAVALTLSAVTATALLRGTLVSRLDTQLTEAVGPFVNQARDQSRFNGPRDRRPRLPSSFFAEVVNADGTVLTFHQPLDADEQAPDLPLLTAAQVVDTGGEPFTVEQAGVDDWRAIVRPRPGGGYVLVAQSLHDVNSTVHSLILIEVIGGLVLLVLISGLGYLLVSRNLHGLTDVEHTASAIAAGDLGRRIPERDPRTEVGSLSLSLNRMLGQIESAFGERTRSEAAARASEERMRRFVSDASHELRTPLTTIRGFAELTRQQARTGHPTDPAAIARIESEAQRMGVLVEDLLLLARLDQQRPLERREVDLLPLAEDAVSSARVAHPDRRIGLMLLPESQAPVVIGDESRLRQVLTNVVGNAGVHTPTGTPIEVAVGTRDGRAVIEVRDHGPGLPPELRDQVFERFYRTDNARNRSTGGSGLGLSIVSALVTAQDGEVHVTETDGGGATFTVSLPLAQPHQG